MIILRYIHCYWLIIYLSITEGVWRIPKLTIAPNHHINLVSQYYNNHITIINSNLYLEIFYHEWRHHYQSVKSTCNFHNYDEGRYGKYKALFRKVREHKLLAHHHSKLHRMFISEFLFEKDAIEYQIRKCPDGELTMYFKSLMN